MDPWIEQAAAEIGSGAPRELEALVAVSSPSGDVHGANECASVCAALVPDEATIERVPCSSPGHAEDLVARAARDRGAARAAARPRRHRRRARRAPPAAARRRAAARLRLGRHEGRRRPRHRRAARASPRAPSSTRELALLLVCDEEWRTADFGHVERFAGFDACLCFEAGELAGADEGVVVQRKAAGTVHVDGARAQRPLRLGARPRAQRAARARRAPPRSSPPSTTRTARRT